ATPVPAAVARLVTEVSRAMFVTKFRAALLLLPAALALGTAGAFALARPAGPAPADEPTARTPIAPAPVAAPAAPDAKPDPPKEEADEPWTVGPPRPGEPAWKAEFRKAYSLADGQAVKLVPGDPFPACRAEGVTKMINPDAPPVTPDR